MQTYIPLNLEQTRLYSLKPGVTETYTIVRWNLNQSFNYPKSGRVGKAHTVLLRDSKGQLKVWSADLSKPDSISGWDRLEKAMAREHACLPVPAGGGAVEPLWQACQHGRIRLTLRCVADQYAPTYSHFEWSPVSGWPTPLAPAPASKAGKANAKRPAIIGDILTMFGED